MNAPPILQRHPALRWMLPVGVAALAGYLATGALGSNAPERENLPRTSPAALIAAAQNPKTDGFSGTVVSHVSLGLPELPATPGDDASLASMLTGSHTLQVWYGGPDQQRIALQGPLDETDVFHDGRQLWEYSSADRSARHAVLPAGASARAASIASAVPSMVPGSLAVDLLGAMSPDTKVEISGSHVVAERAAYDLVLIPRTDATKIGQVRIAIDGQTKVPLAVQVFARGATDPSIDVGFTSIEFRHQADRNFRFDPPSGASVREVRPGQRSAARDTAANRVMTVGRGWTKIVVADPGPRVFKSQQWPTHTLTRVNGSWGSGYLLDADLFSALLTKDGHVYAGAVPPEALYRVAARK